MDRHQIMANLAVRTNTDYSKIPGRSKHFDGKISDVRKLKLRYLSIE